MSGKRICKVSVHRRGIKTKCELYDYIRQRGGHIFLHHENIFLQPKSEGIEKSEYGETSGLFVSGKLTSCSPYLSFDLMRQGGSPVTVNTRLIGNYNLSMRWLPLLLRRILKSLIWLLKKLWKSMSLRTGVRNC